MTGAFHDKRIVIYLGTFQFTKFTWDYIYIGILTPGHSNCIVVCFK